MNREEVMQMLTANASALELSTWLRNPFFPEIEIDLTRNLPEKDLVYIRTSKSPQMRETLPMFVLVWAH